MKVKLKRINENFLLEASGKNDTPVYIDNSSEENPKGASPMELLLMGVGGCSAIDVISILKKQRQEITAYDVEVTGERHVEKEAKVFTAMHVIIYLEGQITPEKAIRAAALSFDKYCSVSLTLAPSVAITHEIIVNGIHLPQS
ncbi:OsmC family protein [Jejudonia soesokkakensis]|uniref:OsmC family protein n=1 Tax=Jejudonia soesokkakensis TaxID=1323432 RepID=A0ABW2MQY8_9FLAO